MGLIPWGRKIIWRRAWQPTPVFLPGESHGQRSLAGHSPQSHKESDVTEATEHTCAMAAQPCEHAKIQYILHFKMVCFMIYCNQVTYNSTGQ